MKILNKALLKTFMILLTDQACTQAAHYIFDYSSTFSVQLQLCHSQETRGQRVSKHERDHVYWHQKFTVCCSCGWKGLPWKPLNISKNIRSWSWSSVLRCEGEDRVTPLHRCKQIKGESEDAREPRGSWEHPGLNIKLQTEALRALTEMSQPHIGWSTQQPSNKTLGMHQKTAAPDKAGSVTLLLTRICKLIHRLLNVESLSAHFVKITKTIYDTVQSHILFSMLSF